MAQLMQLSLTISCFGKIQIGFTCLVLAHLGSPGQRAIEEVLLISAKHFDATNANGKWFKPYYMENIVHFFLDHPV